MDVHEDGQQLLIAHDGGVKLYLDNLNVARCSFLNLLVFGIWQIASTVPRSNFLNPFEPLNEGLDAPKATSTKNRDFHPFSDKKITDYRKLEEPNTQRGQNQPPYRLFQMLLHSSRALGIAISGYSSNKFLFSNSRQGQRREFLSAPQANLINGRECHKNGYERVLWLCRYLSWSGGWPVQIVERITIWGQVGLQDWVYLNQMNNYHFYEQEAKGKYSVIFKARKKRKLDFVAIKRMDKTRKKKILNQARILSELAHPNIIKFYEHIESKNHMWAVTQYCPGGDLLKLIQQDKSLPELIVRGFAIDILRGLQYCHSRGIVICDLKPASVLINEYGMAKIGDFGSSRDLMDLMHAQKESKKGTPSYMAPQLFLAGGVYSFQSDLWSLGCIMYELAQGNPPFVSTTYQEIAHLALSSPTPKVQEFSSDFNNLVEGLLSKQPEDRIFWDALVQHPWIANQLQQCDIPDQPHFRSYCQAKKQQSSSNMKFLRASQDLNNKNQSYSSGSGGTVMRMPMASDRREEFIFESEEGYNEDFQLEDHYNPDEKITLQYNEVAETGFMKKKEKGATGEVRKDKGKTKKEEQKDPERALMEDSSGVNMFLQAISSKNLVPLGEIIQHQSDNGVKPIIGNKDIEVLESFNFNKKSLGFQYIDPDTLAEGILNGDMEEELQEIFDGMVGDEKYNVMGYFESIIQNSDIANYLFKESFIKFYMKLMKGYKQAALRAKMFEIMGFLVRHATVIDPTIIKHGIINAFVEGATKDKSEKVRRKAMAALGELLFYGATQVDEGVPEWDLPLSLIHSLLKILKNSQQDEIVRIYCCKSIENITAQAKDVGIKFAQIDTLMVLINCFISTQNEGFRSAISCCFHHVIQLNVSLREILLEKLGVNNMLEAIKNPDCSPKTLQILLWVLLSQFNKSRTSKISKMYLDDENLFKAILNKLDVIASSTARGRIYLYISLYLEGDPRRSILLLENSANMVAINNSKLFAIIEKQGPAGGGDKQNKYETQCIQYLLVWLQDNFQNLVRLVHEDIKSAVKSNGDYKQLRKGTGYCGILWHMVSCPVFEEMLGTESSIDSLLSILSLLDEVPVSQFSSPQPSPLESIKSTYTQILEKITNNSSISQKLQEYYANKVLPFLVGRILKSKHQDIKFNCMKFFLYLVSYYMNEDYLYDSTILNTTSQRIMGLILNHLLPEIGGLLTADNESEAIPTMVIKMLAVLFEINDCFVRKFHELKLQEVVLEKGFYKEGCNINVLKLVQKVTSVEPPAPGKEAPKWVAEVMKQTVTIMLNFIRTGQQIFLEHPLETLKDLMRINGPNWKQDEVIEVVWDNVVCLQGHEDVVIREKAESLIKAMLEQNRFGGKGKWEIREKQGADNYEKYLQLSGKKRDPKVVENVRPKGGSGNNSRYGM